MMFSRPPRPLAKDGLAAARNQRVVRAGLRSEPRGDEPRGAFVAIEMALLVFVSTLAMAAVIVTTASPADAHGVAVKAGSTEVGSYQIDTARGRLIEGSIHNVDRSVSSRAATE